MTYKILSEKEYYSLDEFDMRITLNSYQFVAVEMANDHFKILKHPLIDMQDRLNILSSREEVEQFIFLNCI